MLLMRFHLCFLLFWLLLAQRIEGAEQLSQYNDVEGDHNQSINPVTVSPLFGIRTQLSYQVTKNESGSKMESSREYPKSSITDSSTTDHNLQSKQRDVSSVLFLEETNEYILSYHRTGNEQLSASALSVRSDRTASVEEVFEFALKSDRSDYYSFLLFNRSRLVENRDQLLSVYVSNDLHSDQVINQRELKWYDDEVYKRVYVHLTSESKRIVLKIKTAPLVASERTFVTLRRQDSCPNSRYVSHKTSFIPIACCMDYQILSNAEEVELDHLSGKVYTTENIHSPIVVQAMQMDNSYVTFSLESAEPVVHILQVHYEMHRPAGMLHLRYSNGTLITTWNMHYQRVVEEIALSEDSYYIEAVGVTYLIHETQGVTVYMDGIPLPLVSVLFDQVEGNVTIPFSTVNPYLSPLWRYYATSDVAEAHMYYDNPSVQPLWNEITDQLLISAQAIVAQWTIHVPIPVPTLVIIGFYYYGSLEVSINGMAVAAFQSETPAIGSHDYFSVPLSYFDNSTVLMLTTLNSGITGLITLESYSFFDPGNTVLLRESLKLSSFPTVSYDYDFLTTATIPSGVYTLSFSNTKRIPISSFNLQLTSNSGAYASLKYSIRFHNSEFPSQFKEDISVVPITTHTLPFFNGIDVDSYTFDLTLQRPLQIEFIPLYYRGGSFCNAVDVFPSTAEGTLSVAPCGDHQWGVVYRSCFHNEWQPVHDELCQYTTPKVSYGDSLLHFYTTTPMTYTPTVKGLVSTFSLRCENGPLAGVSIDPVTGAISGLPEEVTLKTCSVIASNSMTSAYVAIRLLSISGYCEMNGIVYSYEGVLDHSCGVGYLGTVSMICKPSNHSDTGGDFVLYNSDCRFDEPSFVDVPLSDYLFTTLNIVLLCVIFYVIFLIVKTISLDVC